MLKIQHNIFLILFLSFCLLLSSCKKETQEIYELEDFHLQDEQLNKRGLKSSLEQISIAYTDLFAKQISTEELNQLIRVYSAFGDKNIINERVFRSLIARPDVIAPTNAQMRKSIPEFVEETYKRFYGRNANEFEKRYFVQYLTTNTDIEPKDVYYSFMISNEYLYY